MHNRFLAAGATAAILALAACSSEPETINDYDPMAEALKNAGPVELPPAITESRAYRCSDNSLFYVDFYNNNTATIRRTSRDAPATTLTAEGGNPPYVGEGYSVSGNGTNVRINNQACHV